MNPVLSMLGLALRGGRLAVGGEPVSLAVRAGTARLLLSAQDAGASALRHAEHLSETGHCVWLTIPFSKAELGAALGRGSAAVAAVTDLGLAAAVVKRLAALDPAAYGSASERMALKVRRAAERKKAPHRKPPEKPKEPHPPGLRGERRTNGRPGSPPFERGKRPPENRREGPPEAHGGWPAEGRRGPAWERGKRPPGMRGPNQGAPGNRTRKPSRPNGQRPHGKGSGPGRRPGGPGRGGGAKPGGGR